MIYLLAFFIPVFITLIATPVAISWCERWGLLDHPDERKNHSKPTPLAGGLVLFPVIIAAIIIAFHSDIRMPFFILAVSLIFVVGIWDDLKGIHFSTKLAAQTGAAMIMILSGVHVHFAKIIYLNKLGIHLSPAADEIASGLVTFLWIVGITNAVNLIDGLDGLASGLSLNAIIGLFAIAIMGNKNGIALFSLILAGGILGFLRYNLHPAKTFLGDSGSLLLGFTISVMAILQSAKTTTFMVLVIPIIFIAIPMLDTLWAFARRMLKGRHPFEPDREHLHHRLLDLNFTPRQTLGYFYAFSVIMGGTGLWLFQDKSLLVITVSFILLALMVGIIKFMQIFDLHHIVFEANVKLWAFAVRTKGHDLDHSMGLGAGLAILILLPINLVLAFYLPNGNRNVLVAGSLLVAALGLFDIIELRNGKRFKDIFLSISIFFLLLLGQVTTLLLWPGYLLDVPRMISVVIILVAVSLIVSWKSGGFVLLLDEPFEIIVFYMGMVICGYAKIATGATSFAPFIVAFVNSIALLLIFKTVLKKPQFKVSSLPMMEERGWEVE